MSYEQQIVWATFYWRALYLTHDHYIARFQNF